MIPLFTLVFMLISLQDFYSYDLRIPVISVLGSLLALSTSLSIYAIAPAPLNSFAQLIPRRIWTLLFAIYAVPLLCGLIVSTSITLDFSNPRLFSFFMLPALVIALSVMYRSCPTKFTISLRVLLYLHLTFFFFNFVDLYFFGHIFDPIKLFNDAQATHFTYVSGFALRRACGLFQEPGTFSTYYALLLTGYINLTSHIKTHDNFRLVFLSLVALILTFSTYGAIYSIIIFFWQRIYHRSSTLLRGLEFLFVALSSSFFVIRFFSSQLAIQSSKEGSGLDLRADTIGWLNANLFSHPIHTLFGFDILNPLVGRVDFGTAYNDSSMVVFFLIFTGIVGTSIFLIAFASLPRKYWPSLVIFLSSKLSIFAPICALILLANFLEPIKAQRSNQ